MKKNRKALVILLTAAALLGGCGGKSEETVSESVTESTESKQESLQEADVADVSVQSVYEAVEAAVELPSMIKGDDAFISNYYGIDPADLDEYVFAEAEEATLASAVIIMKVKDEDAAERIVGSLNTVINQKAAEMQDYIPEQYEIVADSSVKTEGLYVYLVIAENAGDIESVIQSALK